MDVPRLQTLEQRLRALNQVMADLLEPSVIDAMRQRIRDTLIESADAFAEIIEALQETERRKRLALTEG